MDFQSQKAVHIGFVSIVATALTSALLVRSITGSENAPWILAQP